MLHIVPSINCERDLMVWVRCRILQMNFFLAKRFQQSGAWYMHTFFTQSITELFNKNSTTIYTVH